MYIMYFGGMEKMRNTFERELSKLNRDLVEMGNFITMTIEKTMSAFKTNNYDLAREVHENDDIADELEVMVERRSLRILLSQQPVARDLRAISTALKMISDMERICDQLKNIADIMLRFEGKELIRTPTNILQMSDKCCVMVNKCIESFIKSDVDLAKKVIELDDDIDECFWNIHNNVVELVRENPDNVLQSVDLVMMAKYLERIGDHSVNIAEWVIFAITGEHKDKILL